MGGAQVIRKNSYNKTVENTWIIWNLSAIAFALLQSLHHCPLGHNSPFMPLADSLKLASQMTPTYFWLCLRKGAALLTV